MSYDNSYQDKKGIRSKKLQNLHYKAVLKHISMSLRLCFEITNIFCYSSFLWRCGNKYISRSLCHYFPPGLRTLTTQLLMVFLKIHAIKCVLFWQTAFLVEILVSEL